jgi:hypothetical protein
VRDTRQRRLDAARLGGSAAVAIFAQFAVDAPSGYFGAADRVTTIGTGFVAIVAFLCVIAVTLGLSGRRGARVVAGVQVAVVAATFVPPIASDPVIAGAAVFWHVLLFGQLVARLPPRRRLVAQMRAAREDREIDRGGPAVRHLLGVSVMISIAALGFRVGNRVPAQIVFLIVGLAALGGEMVASTFDDATTRAVTSAAAELRGAVPDDLRAAGILERDVSREGTSFRFRLLVMGGRRAVGWWVTAS